MNANVAYQQSSNDSNSPAYVGNVISPQQQYSLPQGNFQGYGYQALTNGTNNLQSMSLYAGGDEHMSKNLLRQEQNYNNLAKPQYATHFIHQGVNQSAGNSNMKNFQSPVQYTSPQYNSQVSALPANENYVPLTAQSTYYSPQENGVLSLNQTPVYSQNYLNSQPNVGTNPNALQTSSNYVKPLQNSENYYPQTIAYNAQISAENPFQNNYVQYRNRDPSSHKYSMNQSDNRSFHQQNDIQNVPRTVHTVSNKENNTQHGPLYVGNNPQVYQQHNVPQNIYQSNLKNNSQPQQQNYQIQGVPQGNVQGNISSNAPTNNSVPNTHSGLSKMYPERNLQQNQQQQYYYQNNQNTNLTNNVSSTPQSTTKNTNESISYANKEPLIAALGNESRSATYTALQNQSNVSKRTQSCLQLNIIRSKMLELRGGKYYPCLKKANNGLQDDCKRVRCKNCSNKGSCSDPKCSGDANKGNSNIQSTPSTS